MQKIENAAARLPPLTAGVTILTTWLETQREIFGAVWCRDRSIGAMRKRLGRVTELPTTMGPVDTARDQTRVLLAEMCRECPHKHCKMRGW